MNKRHKQPRHDTKKSSSRIVDIRQEISSHQLAAIGALALSFNEAEAALDRLFYVVTDLTEPLQLEISTRINGLEGKIAIVKRGAAQFLEDPDLRLLEDLLGDNAFNNLKDYRDGVVHARHLNPATGVGIKIDRQARVFDYLVRQDALDAAYDLLVAIRKEMDEFVILITAMKELKLPHYSNEGTQAARR